MWRIAARLSLMLSDRAAVKPGPPRPSPEARRERASHASRWVGSDPDRGNPMDTEDPRTAHPQPPQPRQQQEPPGLERKLDPPPDHGEKSYKGSGKLQGRAALITGADSGIGRAVAIAFAREGADVLISYLCEDEDARETARWVEQAGRRAVLMPGDISDPAHCRVLVERAVREFGKLDVLVNNAAHQMTFKSLDAISEEEWDKTFRTNIYSMFYLSKAAVKHM